MTLQEWRDFHGYIDPITGEKQIRNPFKELPDDTLAKYVLHTINGDIYGVGSCRKSLEKSTSECSSLHISTRKQYLDKYNPEL